MIFKGDRWRDFLFFTINQFFSFSSYLFRVLVFIFVRLLV